MKTISKSALVASGIRGFFCAGLATLITGFLSWSFVASTEQMDWMGSEAAWVGETS